MKALLGCLNNFFADAMKDKVYKSAMQRSRYKEKMTATKNFEVLPD
jgi:hypothetical protein